MTDDAPERLLERLAMLLRECAPAAVAVSGGVDSMTLAAVAATVLGDEVTMFHAVSPAVPRAATARVERHAIRASWRLVKLDAGEFADQRYIDNPANRCFFCKQNLYGTLAARTSAQLLSGTNLDDLDDWRPGLAAAAAVGVRHPFVEAHIDKAGIRVLARYLGLDDLAELPAAPCLSSRVETGISIEARDLGFVDAAETLVRHVLAPRTVRCRLRREGIVIELDDEARAGLSAEKFANLHRELSDLARRHHVDGQVEIATYRRGSAFLRGHGDP